MAESKMVSLALLVFLGAKEDREGVHGGGGGWESGFLYHKSWAETMKWIIIIMFSTFGTQMICVDLRVPIQLEYLKKFGSKVSPSVVDGPVDSHWCVHRWAWHWSNDFWKTSA